MRMQNPYEDARAERVAIVDALLLLEYVAYTTPPILCRDAIRKTRRILSDRYFQLASSDIGQEKLPSVNVAESIRRGGVVYVDDH